MKRFIRVVGPSSRLGVVDVRQATVRSVPAPCAKWRLPVLAAASHEEEAEEDGEMEERE